MITLDLTAEDGAFLAEQLNNHRRHIENELVHTDTRAMQAELARDLERLERIWHHLNRAVTLARTNIAV